MLGTVIAIPVTHLLAPYLFGITARDPATYVAAAVTLSIVALVASALPVRRASVTDHGSQGRLNGVGRGQRRGWDGLA